MSFETVCKCDARGGCSNRLEITDYDYADDEFEESNWHEDPNESNTHYCNKCWVVVKEELGIDD